MMLLGLLVCCGLAAQDAPPKQLPTVNGPKPANKQDNNSPPKKDQQKDAAKKGITPAAAQVDSGSNPPAEQSDINPTPQPKEQTFPIMQPHSSDPLQGLWYSIIGISGLSILALGYTAWRLKTAGEAPAPDIDSLSGQLDAVRKQASRARSRYDDLARQASRVAAQSPRPDPAPQPPYVREPLPARPADPYVKDPYGKEPVEARSPVRRLGPPPDITFRGGGSKPPSPAIIRPRDELVEAYNLARASPDRAARDQFDSRYPYVRISCTNHEDWQYHKNVTLRFEREDFGWYLMVDRGGRCQAFPWFTQDLSSERESFKGVFQYPDGSGDASLRIVRAALLQSQGDGWILTTPGEVQADA